MVSEPQWSVVKLIEVEVADSIKISTPKTFFFKFNQNNCSKQIFHHSLSKFV